MKTDSIDTTPSTATDFESRHMEDVSTGEALFAAERPMSECECSDQEYGWEFAADKDGDRKFEELGSRLESRIAESRARRALAA